MSNELKKCEVCGEEKKNLGVHMRKHKEKGIPPAGTGMSPVIETEKIDPIDKKLDAVISGLNSVAAAVSKLVDLQTKERIEITGAPTSVESGFTPHVEDSTYPTGYMPPKYRKIVDEVLSPEFKARVQDFEDRTDFQFDVIVPSQYSSVSPTDKEKGVEDIRSRIMPRALGENGVREWCMLIRKNLNKFYQKEGVQSPFSTQA